MECWVCGGEIANGRTRNDGRILCADCLRSEMIRERERVQLPNPSSCVPVVVLDEDECTEIDTRRFRNVEQGDT